MLSKRQARFGIVEPAAKPSSTPAKPTGTAAPAAGAAAAAGIKKSGLVLDAAEEEKKRKRAAKFGLPSVCFLPFCLLNWFDIWRLCRNCCFIVLTALFCFCSYSCITC